MLSFARRLALSLATMAVFSVQANAAPIVITFEAFPGPDGILGTGDDTSPLNTYIQSLDNQFSSMGLTFTQGSLFKDSFYNGNPDNHFISSTNPIATLSVPVYGISIDSYSVWNATLTAYDQQGHILASNVLRNPSEGAGFYRGTVVVNTNAPIFSFSVLPSQPNYILNLDNLTLQTSPVPEPSQYLMLAAGLALVAARTMRRKT